MTMALFGSLLLFPNQGLALVDESTQVSHLKEIASIPIGDGFGQISMQKLEGGLDLGPDSFAVRPNGKSFIIDSFKKQILQIQNGDVSVIDISFINQPRDIIVTPTEEMYILNTSPPSVFKLSKKGEVIKEYKLPSEFPSERILKLGQLSPTKITIQVAGQEEYLLDDLEQGQVVSNQGHMISALKKSEVKKKDLNHTVVQIDENAIEITGER